MYIFTKEPSFRSRIDAFLIRESLDNRIRHFSPVYREYFETGPHRYDHRWVTRAWHKSREITGGSRDREGRTGCRTKPVGGIGTWSGIRERGRSPVRSRRREETRPRWKARVHGTGAGNSRTGEKSSRRTMEGKAIAEGGKEERRRSRGVAVLWECQVDSVLGPFCSEGGDTRATVCERACNLPAKSPRRTHGFNRIK